VPEQSLPADSAQISQPGPAPQTQPQVQETPPPKPKPVPFQPAADLSLEAFEQTSAKLATFEGGYTKAHMQNTAAFANKMAEVLQLSAKETRDLNEAAHVYDAGKLVSDEAIYNDPRGPKDMPKEEWGAMWREMCRHVEISTESSRLQGKASDPQVESTLGALNSKVAAGDDGVRQIIRHHHEKLDGTGYPDRLQGDQIPKGAQILGICDMYEALRQPRSFRPAKDHETARVILEGDAKNGKLNPELVKVFFEQVVPGGDYPRQ
jgi:HD-GYP domain-containing protein (c-di-GMP phosphodiesterase class II)